MWRKVLSDGSVAVALLNRGESTATVSTTAAQVNAPSASSYTLTDVWSDGVRQTASAISSVVPPHSVVMTFQPDGTIKGVQSGKCLDVREAATGNNSELILWTCSAANNQKRTRF